MTIVTETTRNIKVDEWFTNSSKHGKMERNTAGNEREGMNLSQKLEEKNATAQDASEVARANKDT